MGQLREGFTSASQKLTAMSQLKREDLEAWVIAALEASGGAAAPIAVARHIWQNHEAELRNGGDMFYKWQYDMRWSARALRNKGLLKEVGVGERGKWCLS